MRRIGEGVLLIAIVIFGAVLRFNGLAVPSLWLDEILDYDVATKLTHEPLWHFITNGLLFLSSELAGRFVHAPELSARFAPAVFGCLALVVAVGCRVSGVGKNDFAERVTFALLLA